MVRDSYGNDLNQKDEERTVFHQESEPKSLSSTYKLCYYYHRDGLGTVNEGKGTVYLKFLILKMVKKFVY